MSDVKAPRRRYNSTGRQAQARRNQEVILEAAQRQFLDAGYGGATVAIIAAAAEVSVETVYKTFGGKSGLVRALYDRALRGGERQSAYERSDDMRTRESDPRTIMRNWSELTTEVAVRMTPIRLLIRAAAVIDPEITALQQSADRERLERMTHHAGFLAERGYLRDDISLDKAADILYTCSSLEMYDILVLQRNWPHHEFARFIADFMITGLLPTNDGT